MYALGGARACLQLMQLERMRSVPNLQVHYADPQLCVGSRALAVLTSRDGGTNWQRLAGLPATPAHRLTARMELPRRLLRGGIHLIQPRPENCPPNENGGNHTPPAEWIAVAGRTVYGVSAETGAVRSVYAIPRGSRPLRHGMWVDRDTLYIGEYWSNPERGPADIFAVDLAGQGVRTLYRFPAGSIRHVHTVDWDPYAECFWVSTGDSDPECTVMLLDRQGQRRETVGGGSQKWRSVSFVFTPHAVYWGTDNHTGHNHIWRWDRRSGETHSIGDVVGPVYYSAGLRDYRIFGTTVEKGEGDQDRFGRLYAVDCEDRVHEVWKAEKDRWSAHYFGYGVFEFAEGTLGANQFWVTMKGFKSGLRSVLFTVKE